MEKLKYLIILLIIPLIFTGCIGNPSSTLNMNNMLFIQAFTGDPLMISQNLYKDVNKHSKSSLYQPLYFRNYGKSRALKKALSKSNDSSIVVVLYWDKEFSDSESNGYRVYRSADNYNWEMLGLASYNPDGEVYEFSDDSTAVIPESTLYYKVVPLNKDNIEGMGRSDSITPLAQFNLNLLEPADNSSNISTTPCFTWSQTDLSDITGYSYDLSIIGSQDAIELSLESDNAQTYYVYDNESNFLVENATYQWNIVAIGTRKCSDNSSAFSYANVNGPFSFDTNTGTE